MGDRLPQVESKSVLRRLKIQKKVKIDVLKKEIDKLYVGIADIEQKIITGEREYNYLCPSCGDKLPRIFLLGEQPNTVKSFCEKTGKDSVCVLVGNSE